MIKTKGYTLIEILIVIVILAVLAVMALVQFTGQDERGIVSEAVAHLSAIRQAEAGYNLENSVYLAMDTALPADDTKWATAGIDKPSTTNFNYKCDLAGLSTATRQPVAGTCTLSGADPYGGCTITLTAAGAWGGTHPHTPT